MLLYTILSLVRVGREEYLVQRRVTAIETRGISIVGGILWYEAASRRPLFTYTVLLGVCLKDK